LDADIAVVTVVGHNMHSVPGIVGRTFVALGRESVHILAIAQSASESTLSFVVAKPAMQVALSGVHKEFRLDLSPLDGMDVESLAGNENCYQHSALVQTSQLPDQGD
jgi:predicted amino acid-binding ACT domain protein